MRSESFHEGARFIDQTDRLSSQQKEQVLRGSGLDMSESKGMLEKVSQNRGECATKYTCKESISTIQAYRPLAAHEDLGKVYKSQMGRLTLRGPQISQLRILGL